MHVGYNQPLGHGLRVDAPVRQEAYFFGRLDELDFWGTFGDVRLSYRPVESGPVLFVTAQPYRYENMDTGDQFLSAVNVVVGATQSSVFNTINRCFTLATVFTTGSLLRSGQTVMLIGQSLGWTILWRIV